MQLNILLNSLVIIGNKTSKKRLIFARFFPGLNIDIIFIIFHCSSIKLIFDFKYACNYEILLNWLILEKSVIDQAIELYRLILVLIVVLISFFLMLFAGSSSWYTSCRYQLHSSLLLSEWNLEWRSTSSS